MTNKILWISALLGFLLATGVNAQAPEMLNPPAKISVKTKTKTPKHAADAKTKFMSGYQETKKRAHRLIGTRL